MKTEPPPLSSPARLFPNAHAWASGDISLDAATYFVIDFEGDGTYSNFIILVGSPRQPEAYAASYCTCCSRNTMARDLMAVCGDRPIFARFGREVTPLPATNARRLLANYERVGDTFFAKADQAIAEKERTEATLQ